MTQSVVALFAAGLWLSLVHGQQSACQTSFVNAFYQCLGNRSLDRDNFLWLARGGQVGVPPADLAVFTQRACIEKPGLYLCVKGILGKVQALSEAQCPQTQKDSIGRLASEIFYNLNSRCQHPCRSTLKQTMEKCFTDRNFVSPEYLIFNVTIPRDSIIGSNQPDVVRFCQSRSDIISCLKMAAVTCEDSRILLRSYGLDLDSLDLTYILLCNSTALYEAAKDCSPRSSEPALLQCRNVLSTNMAALDSQLASMNITDSQYRDQACLERANQLQCELSSAAPQNGSVKCNNPAILGLRRQQECSLFPLECRISNQASLDTLCLPAEFHLPERQAYTAAATFVTACAGIAMLSMAMYMFVVF
ncbi:hypothetical protein BsWGS_26781 [Bradybaena similaris]